LTPAINVSGKKYSKLKKTMLFIVLRFRNWKELKLNKNGIFLNSFTGIVNNCMEITNLK